MNDLKPGCGVLFKLDQEVRRPSCINSLRARTAEIPGMVCYAMQRQSLWHYLLRGSHVSLLQQQGLRHRVQTDSIATKEIGDRDADLEPLFRSKNTI